MTLPDKDRLVLIRCQPSGGGPQTVGTGYFITDDLVLTVSHVVDIQQESVRVRSEQTGAWTQAEVVWREERLDAALLRASDGLANSGPAVKWAQSAPTANVPWTSTGYPVAASDVVAGRSIIKTAGLDGAVYAQGGGGQGQPELELNVNAPPGDQGWGGISGAPVFVGDELVGIVKSFPAAFEGRRLAAVPVAALLRDASFRLAIAPPWLSDLPAEPWVLVLLAEREQDDLVESVRTAIQLYTDRSGLEPIHAEPRVVNVKEALETPERWLQLVRALCQAPIMVADVTDFQPAIMLFLGIRAVVRRGVTITTTANTLDESELSSLPFNIQESKLISHGGIYEVEDPKNPFNILVTAIRDGLAELRTHTGYLDLPAYDAVRQPLPESLPRAVSARDHILMLCPFREEYRRQWLFLSNVLARHYLPRTVCRMSDIISPRLVGQALYEHIRWATICVVDWTYWRANVFFEFGVRLACSSTPPFLLIDHAQVVSLDRADALPADQANPVPAGQVQASVVRQPLLEQKGQLLRLFRPFVYTVSQVLKDREKLAAALDQHDVDVQEPGSTQDRDQIPYDGTYRAAVDAFEWQQDPLTLRPHDLLRGSAEAQLGKDPQKYGASPVLFSMNAGFAQALRRSVEERWIGAWYYLRYRYSLDEFRADEKLRVELRALGTAAQQWLPPDSSDPHVKRVREEITTLIFELEDLDDPPEARR